MVRKMVKRTMKKEVPAGTNYQLQPNWELRFEVKDSKKVTLELISGFAEIFGSQLIKGKKYQFVQNIAVAIFTFHGCTVRFSGDSCDCYISKNTDAMHFYVNCHGALENLREAAKKETKRGPVIMVVGPNNVGKSTICQILLNYSARLGGRPLFVDLDAGGHGQIGLPGTIGALSVEIPADIVDGFSQQAPLVFHYGHHTPAENPILYNRIVSRLAEVCSDRLQTNKLSKVSGMVINTCGWINNDGSKAIAHAVEAFGVDVVLVVDHDRLHNDLAKTLPKNVRVIQTPKSCGVVRRSEEEKAVAVTDRVRRYFYGSRIKLFPHSFTIKWHKLKIFKISESIGANENPTKLVVVRPGMQLSYQVLSISHAKLITKDPLKINVLGFYCVTEVDVIQKTITVLSPQPRPLPDTILLLSDTHYMDN